MAEEPTEKKRIFPRDHKPSLWRRIRWKLQNLRSFLENIPNNIIMICQWIPILWNNWDWDYNFLMDVMQYKIQRMSNHIKEHDRLMNSQKYAAQMQLCADTIQRLREDNYIEHEVEEHNSKWGQLICESIPLEEEHPSFGILYKMDLYHEKARELGLEDQEQEEMQALRELEDARRQADWDLLFSQMRENIQSWWD